MKKYIQYIPVFLLLFFASCEEVVEVDLEESEPRLVIEASIVWYKGTSGNQQSIELSETSPFYEEELTPVENASVFIISENGELVGKETSNVLKLILKDGNYYSDVYSKDPAERRRNRGNFTKTYRKRKINRRKACNN